MSDVIEDELEQSVCKGNVKAAQTIFANHPEYIRRPYNNYDSWLNMAVACSQKSMVELLLKLGCDPNVGIQGSDHETPLWTALGQDNDELVRILLEHGADPNSHKIVISAIVGMRRNSLEMVKLLEKHGADLHRNYIDELKNQPMNALSAAIDWDKQDVIAYLRSKGGVLPTEGAASSPANPKRRK